MITDLLFQILFSPFLAMLFFLGYTWTTQVDNVDTAFAAIANNLQTEKLDRDGQIPATGVQQWDKGADVTPAAGVLTLGNDGNYFDVAAGNFATIVQLAFGGAAVQAGTEVKLHFDGVSVITHSADIVLPGGANITSAAGDEGIFMNYAAGDWRLIAYTRATGKALVGAELVDDTTPQLGANLDVNGKLIVFGDSAPNITPKARAYRNAAFNVNDSSNTKIQLDAETFDIGADFDPVTNFRFVCPVNGYYLICGQITWAGNATGIRTATINLNGTTIASTAIMNIGASFQAGANCSTIVYATATQYFELYGYQTSGGVLGVVVGDSNTFLCIHLLSV